MAETTNLKTGTIKWFSAEKGYGFIVRDDGQADIFVHASGVRYGKKLNQGDRVEFEITNGQRGPKAVHVRVMEAACGAAAETAPTPTPTQ